MNEFVWKINCKGQSEEFQALCMVHGVPETIVFDAHFFDKTCKLHPFINLERVVFVVGLYHGPDLFFVSAIVIDVFSVHPKIYYFREWGRSTHLNEQMVWFRYFHIKFFYVRIEFIYIWWTNGKYVIILIASSKRVDAFQWKKYAKYKRK